MYVFWLGLGECEEGAEDVWPECDRGNMPRHEQDESIGSGWMN